MKYEIIGEPMPVVVCDLEANEAMITERGSMVWMSPNMKMETGAGGIGKAFGRMFSGKPLPPASLGPLRRWRLTRPTP